MIDFKKIEDEARKVWSKNKSLIKKAVQDDSGKKLFSFLEGPPTANAPPGLHHLEVRTFKDIICKFRFMQGFSVPRKEGWDCHGLPVEVQVEKKLGLDSKKDIVKYGQNKFIEKCRDSVFCNIKDWEKSTEELGYWIDLENPYVTLDNNYVESVWWSLKELYKKKLLYEGFKVVPFCPRCGTPLSSHEVAQGYKAITEDSVVVKFKLTNKDAYLLVWTTTPWTLPGNLAIAVNPKLDYVYVKHERKQFIVLKELAEKYFKHPKIIKTIKGKKLIGGKYEPLFDYFDNEDAFKIIGGDFVTAEEGTGIVHMAPAFGEVDYEACQENNLPFVQPVDESGHFTKEVPELEGKFIKNADKLIIQKLQNENKLFSVIKYSHDYPFCWRCQSPLMSYAIKYWFIKVSDVKNKLVKLNKKINWDPRHIKEGRFGLWLKGIKDWSLSRFKFWGTPLPIWRCECGKEKIIGSVKELKKNSVKKFQKYDLHRPWIDNIKITCPKCKKEMTRIPDVIDCWYDSGSASFAQFHYPFENKKEFERRFPYDFISEAIDQTRGWFYTLHAIATMLFENVAYKNVICAGLVVDENGEKMSKSKGNIISPKQVINHVGVDATRLQFCTSNPGNEKRFSVDMIKESVLPFLTVLYNCKKFYEQAESNKNSMQIEDKWILSKLNSLIKKITKDLENYSIDDALLSLMDFVVNDFSRTYIKITRDRDDVKKILGEILKKVSLVLAPYAPHISEYVYQDFEVQSVHLSKWPKAKNKIIDEKLEKQFDMAFQIIEKGLAQRDKAQIGLKWPLSKAIVSINTSINKQLKKIIANQLNVKKIEIKKKKGNKINVKLNTKLNSELEAEGYAREISRKVQASRKKAGLVKTDKIKLALFVEDDFAKLIEKQVDMIKQRTNSKEILIGDGKYRGYKHEVHDKIKGKKVEIFFNKI